MGRVRDEVIRLLQEGATPYGVGRMGIVSERQALDIYEVAFEPIRCDLCGIELEQGEERRCRECMAVWGLAEVGSVAQRSRGMDLGRALAELLDLAQLLESGPERRGQVAHHAEVIG